MSYICSQKLLKEVGMAAPKHNIYNFNSGKINYKINIHGEYVCSLVYSCNIKILNIHDHNQLDKMSFCCTNFAYVVNVLHAHSLDTRRTVHELCSCYINKQKLMEKKT